MEEVDLEPIRKKTPRRLYYWGLLGLIPNIGVISGLVLLIQGINQYKDRKLIVIGVSNILFTAIFWTMLYPAIENSEFVVSSNVSSSKMQLNSIFQAVEFYKLENGVYPDNLKQLHKRDGNLVLVDFLQFKTGSEKINYYNYMKVVNKYYLFSSGLDGIPNTPDDFYPIINIGDSSKFGLILKELN